MHRPIETLLKMANAQQAAYTGTLIAVRLVETHRRSQHHILPLISPIVELQGQLTELSDLFPSCSRYTGTQKYKLSLSSKNIFVERLTAVVENAHELKLLGVPAYQSGTHQNAGDIL